MSPVPDGNDMPENNHPEEGTIQDEPLPHHMIGQIPSDSDEEEEGEEFAYDGQEYVYAPLPQDPEGALPQDEADSSDSPEEDPGAYADEGVRLEMGDGQGPSPLSPATQVPDLPRPDESDLLWNQPRASCSGPIDQAQAEEVKSAMAGFQLPLSNHPDWARNLSDEDWKAQLLNRLQGNKSSDFKAKFDK
ncbi:male-enhanced antigen 1-like [Liolophura sinensis]|uniref:male-enhanced antigen 1-like n=1 Tax=Liolophura sinensis TaxID=3198878 RepID=UPI00315867E8